MDRYSDGKYYFISIVYIYDGIFFGVYDNIRSSRYHVL